MSGAGHHNRCNLLAVEPEALKAFRAGCGADAAKPVRERPTDVNMEFSTLGGALVLGLAGWAWHDANRAREQAIIAGRLACRQMDVQLLDETVALDRLGLQRGADGRLHLARRYRLEFSLDGRERRRGYVQVLGRRIARVQLDLPDGSTIL